MANKNKKVDEKDFVKLIVIIGVLVLSYFVYANFIPKNSQTTIKIDVIEITKDCTDCFDVSLIANSLAETGAEVDDHDVYTYDSKEGQSAISKYGIEKFPALIVESKNINDIGLEGAFDITDNYAVFKMNVPYVKEDSENVKGIVSMIEIQPECDNCFPLSPVKGKFEELGIKVINYEIVKDDSARGQELIDKYNLEFAPALLISKDIDEYAWIMAEARGALKDLGDYYLFKDAIAPYKDLKSDSIKGEVEITMLTDSNCTDCFDVNGLKQSFQGMGVYFSDEKVLDIVAAEGMAFAKRYNITKAPMVVLSKEILDYVQLRDILFEAGTFDEEDQSFVFRKPEAVGKISIINEEEGQNGSR
jgi:hypothetical protein